MSGQRQSAPAEPVMRPRSIRLVAFDEVCPYLPCRQATLEGFFASGIDPEFYRQLMDQGFRRSGRFFYHTNCAECRQCVPIRIPLATFSPSRSQRRRLRRNADLVVTAGEPELTDEKLDLYSNYLQEKHGASSEKDMAALRDFLYNPVVATREFCYRSGDGKLLAVGICDVFADALSSVYCYYDLSEARRGLGTYSALYEIGYARRLSLAYYYLGFFIEECPAMAYKAYYRPHQLLGPKGVWQ